MATIGQVAYKRPLKQCGMEELAARQRVIAPSGGVLFARNVDGEEKVKAREQIINLVLEQSWLDGLHILTMPGVDWRFERRLLYERQPGWMKHTYARGTYFTACENDRALFYAGVTQMPGLHTPDSELKKIKPYPFAEFGVKTRFASFFFANIDDFMAAEWRGGWNVVWLDYTGPLTVERLSVIQWFYDRYVHDILIVTSLKSRFNQPAMQAMQEAGGFWPWVRLYFENILHETEYFDTSAMAQFAVRKRN